MTIWVDGVVVFSKSSWKFICEQDIQAGSETLATRFGWAKRGFIFEVFDGDTLVASADYPTAWQQVLPFVLLGMVFGFSVEYFNLLGWGRDSRKRVSRCSCLLSAKLGQFHPVSPAQGVLVQGCFTDSPRPMP